jgi:hypothetical protein
MDILHRDFLGHSFIWWQGVVEDNKDPLKLGRCRVRILGFHTADKKDIPTDKLPWATPIQPITSAAISGIGYSPTGLVPGSWVVGFFRDGISAQEPIIMGSIGGIPEEKADKRKGFNDPRTEEQLQSSPKDEFDVQEYPFDGSGALLLNKELGKTYPKHEGSGPHQSTLNEADTNRLARGGDCNEDETIVGLKKRTAQTNIPTALTTDRPKQVTQSLPAVGGSVRTKSTDGRLWDERKTEYAAEYPYNHVYESESGHTFEVDDTPNAERITQYHRSGTHYEIFPDGSKVERIVKDNYTIILKDDHVHIDGNATVTIDKSLRLLQNVDEEANNFDIQVGANANVNLEVMKGSVNLTLHNGDYNAYVNGDYTIDVTGNMTERIGKKRFSHSGEDTEIKTNQSFLVNATKNIIEKCGGFRDMKTGLHTVLNSGKYHRFVSVADTIIKGSTIQLN